MTDLLTVLPENPSEHYEVASHRVDDTSFEDVQEANTAWWTEHTMSYDWNSHIDCEKFSLEWYDEIDRRFIHDSRLYGHDQAPFDRMIPFEKLKGRKVLEIGCGMGFHTELLIRAGADVTSIDISPTSVESTKRRLELKGLTANVSQQDAENIPFDDHEFDYVWSWGVIHHSSRTARIVRQISRILKSDGECALMVYNREGASAWRSIIKYNLMFLGALRGRSTDEALNLGTDGFQARHYTADQLEDLFRAFFEDVESYVCGQVPDSLPLPRVVRGLCEKMVTENWLKKTQSTRGSFLFLTAKNAWETGAFNRTDDARRAA